MTCIQCVVGLASIPGTSAHTLLYSLFHVQILFGEDEIMGGDLLPDFQCQVKELFETE